GIDEPQRLPGYRVTEGFFAMLGMKPVLGRDFTHEEFTPGKGRVVMISEGAWRDRFGADPGVLGRSLTLNGQLFTVIAVAPQIHFGVIRADLFTPLDQDPAQAGRRNDFLFTLGRLKPGVPLEQAQQEMTGIARQLELAYPQSNASWTIRLVPLHE